MLNYSSGLYIGTTCKLMPMPNDHSARTRKQKLNSTHYSLDCSSISMHLTTSLFFVSKILCLERGATTARGISERVLRDDKRRADDVVLVIHSRATCVCVCVDGGADGGADGGVDGGCRGARAKTAG